MTITGGGTKTAGVRIHSDAIVYLAADEMYADGIKFFISEANKVVYTQGVLDHTERVVPVRYIRYIRTVPGEQIYLRDEPAAAPSSAEPARQRPPLPVPLSRPSLDKASFPTPAETQAMLGRQQNNFSWPRPPTVPGQSSSSGSSGPPPPKRICPTVEAEEVPAVKPKQFTAFSSTTAVVEPEREPAPYKFPPPTKPAPDNSVPHKNPPVTKRAPVTASAAAAPSSAAPPAAVQLQVPVPAHMTIPRAAAPSGAAPVCCLRRRH